MFRLEDDECGECARSREFLILYDIINVMTLKLAAGRRGQHSVTHTVVFGVSEITQLPRDGYCVQKATAQLLFFLTKELAASNYARLFFDK
jgi:hypothetical protein